MIFKSDKQESEKQHEQDLLDKLAELIGIGDTFMFMGVKCSLKYYGSMLANGSGKEVGIKARYLDRNGVFREIKFTKDESLAIMNKFTDQLK